MKAVGRAFFVVLLSLLSACGAAEPVAEETAQPEIIALQVTPAVEHWLPWVAACAADIPDFGVYIQVLPRADLDLLESDLILRLGERLESDPFVAVMGVEEIVVVAGEDVPVASLSLESLQAIYRGEINRWDELSEAGNEPSKRAVPITRLAYPEGHEIELLFNRAYLKDEPILAAPQTFSTIGFLEKLMERYPAAIGYLLRSQVPEGMRILEITDDQPIPADQLVLAITSRESEGRLKALLTCLQNVP
jgi:DNA-binding transcriptional LysR family regulator